MRRKKSRKHIKTEIIISLVLLKIFQHDKSDDTKIKSPNIIGVDHTLPLKTSKQLYEGKKT
jgi:hypothetical protein